jgi:hypothetical protein
LSRSKSHERSIKFTMSSLAVPSHERAVAISPMWSAPGGSRATRKLNRRSPASHAPAEHLNRPDPQRVIPLQYAAHLVFKILLFLTSWPFVRSMSRSRQAHPSVWTARAILTNGDPSLPFTLNQHTPASVIARLLLILSLNLTAVLPRHAPIPATTGIF